MAKQSLESFENKTTKRILTGAALAAVLTFAGIRITEQNRGDELGRAQHQADHPTHIGAPAGSVEAGK